MKIRNRFATPIPKGEDLANEHAIGAVNVNLLLTPRVILPDDLAIELIVCGVLKISTRVNWLCQISKNTKCIPEVDEECSAGIRNIHHVLV